MAKNSQYEMEHTNGKITKQEDQMLVILLSLVNLNGMEKKRKVLDNIKDCNYLYLNDRDKVKISPTEYRWENELAFMVARLKRIDCMPESCQQGYWRITNHGKNVLKDFILVYFEELHNDIFGGRLTKNWYQSAKAWIISVQKDYPDMYLNPVIMQEIDWMTD